MNHPRVATQGISGSFHHQAATVLLPDTDITLVPCDNFAEVFAAVAEGRASYGVTAIENSIHGAINQTYRLFERYNLWIGAETTLHIAQYLIGSRGHELAELNNPETIVLSQAPALAQVELWLDEHLPVAKRQETHDTAASVEMVMQNPKQPWLAVAGKQAAEQYGGQIVAGPINDDPRNYTRFVLLHKAPLPRPDANRTSIILKTNHQPGALYHALGIFESHGINLSRLDSHPIPSDKRHYAFYIDMDTSDKSLAGADIIQKLRDAGYGVKVLGSYIAN